MSDPKHTSHWTDRLRASSRIQRAAVGAGLVLYGIVAVGLLWSGSGIRGAARDAREAGARVQRKQREVDEALRLLERRLAELRAAREEAAGSGLRMERELIRAGLIDTSTAALATAAADTVTTALVVPVVLDGDPPLP